MNTVPFVDLKAQYREIKQEVSAAVDRVLESGHFVLGPELAAFEAEFAEYCGAQYAVGVNSGTSALHLALLAAGVGPGDEVITVPFTFVATAAAIGYTGARPVFVDIAADSFTMDASQVEAAITPQTKAILPVHLYGQATDLDPLRELAGRYGLVLIEDAAQAHRAEYKGQRVGSLGDMGCFSFYPGKNLGAYGEGGMVVTNNPEYARTVRVLRDWGQEQKYHHTLKGYNYRLEELQAAILRVKLRRLDAWTDARRSHAAQYDRLLADAFGANGHGVVAPREMAYARHVYHVYAIRTGEREAVQAALRERGIQTGIHYPIPVHLQPAYADLGYKPGDFPRAEQAAAEVLSLPMFPELTPAQVEAVVEAVKEVSGALPRPVIEDARAYA